MTISVFIDNNVWDFLFKHQLDLSIELPKPEFSLCITSEAEFEIRPLENLKPELWAFITRVMRDAGIETDTYFGFNDPSLLSHEQRIGGFDSSRFISNEEGEFIAAQRQLNRPSYGTLKKKSRLYNYEADISLGARSFHSVVLSLDKKGGPLADAHAQGNMVVFLTGFDPNTQKLSDVVRAAFKKP